MFSYYSAVPLFYSFEREPDTGMLYSTGTPSSLGMKGRFIATQELLNLNRGETYLDLHENLGKFQLNIYIYPYFVSIILF